MTYGMSRVHFDFIPAIYPIWLSCHRSCRHVWLRPSEILQMTPLVTMWTSKRRTSHETLHYASPSASSQVKPTCTTRLQGHEHEGANFSFSRRTQLTMIVKYQSMMSGESLEGAALVAVRNLLRLSQPRHQERFTADQLHFIEDVISMTSLFVLSVVASLLCVALKAMFANLSYFQPSRTQQQHLTW